MSLKVSGGGCPRLAARALGVVSSLCVPLSRAGASGVGAVLSLPSPRCVLLPGWDGSKTDAEVCAHSPSLGDSCGLGWQQGGLAGVCSGPEPSMPVVSVPGALG